MKKSIIAFVVLWAFFTLNFIWVAGTIDASKWSRGLVGWYFCLLIVLLFLCCFWGAFLYDEGKNPPEEGGY